MKYILVLGNPDVGFSYRGPFETESDVLQYAEYEMGLDIDWWVQPLKEPGEIVTPSPDMPLYDDFTNNAFMDLRAKRGETSRVSVEDRKLIDYLANRLIDMKIYYRDGNCTNLNIDNLVLVPKKKTTYR